MVALIFAIINLLNKSDMKQANHLLIGFIMLMQAFLSYAQAYDTTQYFGKMNYIFQNVNENLVSTGILKNNGIEFLNLDNV
jgi:hypothetical protein